MINEIWTILNNDIVLKELIVLCGNCHEKFHDIKGKEA